MGQSRRQWGVQRHGQTRFYVVSYDIPDDRRRNRVHRLLSGFGTNVQDSVFECYLTATQVTMLQEELRREINRAEDHMRFYSLCRECQKHIEALAGQPPSEPHAYFA
ncbi:MAG TPA: CRISPR-associated endonuclease Cas2 [Chloroflexota bacterium]|nr:CRISPR-associated endonuclease Cas2 [Chloroflexota bacterium]